MGNSNSSKINENKLINNNSNKNKDYLYEYKCKVEISELDTVKKNEYFTLYLCENHIVLENEYREVSFIYQNVLCWKSSSKFFAFCYKNINKNYIITLKVEDGNIIAKNLNKIVYELLDYYKTI